MKTKTAFLAIFLTLTNVTLQADIDTSPAVEMAQSADTQEDDSADALPQSKYVTEQNETNTPKKDNSRLYNFLLALAAVAVATVAIILVSNNQGKYSHTHKSN